MFVRLWMTRDPITVRPDATVAEARATMDQGAFRHLPVVDGGEVVGFVCEEDLRGRELHGGETRVEHHMTKNPVQVDPYLPLEEAVLLLRRHKAGGLPVVHKGKLVGIITESDIFDAFSQIMAGEVEAVRLTFDGQEGDRILRKAVLLCERFDLDVLSFVSHVRGADEGRRIFAVRSLGGRVEEFVEALWKGGFRVLQNLSPGCKGDGAVLDQAPVVEASLVIAGPRTGEALSWLGRQIEDYGLDLKSLSSRPHSQDPDRAQIALKLRGTELERFERELTKGGFEVQQVKVLGVAKKS